MLHLGLKTFSLILLLSHLAFSPCLAMDQIFLPEAPKAKTFQRIILPKELSNGEPFIIRLGTIAWMVEKYFEHLNVEEKTPYPALQTKQNPKLLLQGIEALKSEISKKGKDSAILEDLEYFTSLVKCHPSNTGINENKLGYHPFLGWSSGKKRITKGLLPKLAYLEDLQNIIAAIPGKKGDFTGRPEDGVNRQPFEKAFKSVLDSTPTVGDCFAQNLWIMYPPINIDIPYSPETFSSFMKNYQEKFGSHKKVILKIIKSEPLNLENIIETLAHTKILIWGLDLIATNIDSEGIHAIAEMLKTNTSITWVDLACNNIADQGVQWISEALRLNKTLSSLNLGYNKIGQEGVKLIGEALQTNSFLLSLCLTHNNLGNEGAKYIGTALQTNKTLTILNLQNANISDEGVKYLAEALKINTSLKALNISHNRMNDEGAALIIEMLKSNTSLISLNASFNNISHTLKDKLFEICQQKNIKVTL